MLKNVEIYSKSNCVFCDKAKNYFKQKDIPYKEYNVEITEVFDVLMTRNPNARIISVTAVFKWQEKLIIKLFTPPHSPLC